MNNEQRIGWMIERKSDHRWLKGTELNLREESAWTDNPNNAIVFENDASGLVLLMSLRRHTARLGFRPRIEEFAVTEHQWI